MIEPRSREAGLKALTLTQPWATLMALQKKRIETRGWYTGYRGELVIHAAKGFPRWAKDLVSHDVRFAHALDGRTWNELPLCVGVCVVNLVGCVRTENLHKAEFILGEKPSVEELAFGDYSPGRYAWLTKFVRMLPNVGPVKGSLGLWDWAESDQERAENDLLSGRAHL